MYLVHDKAKVEDSWCKGQDFGPGLGTQNLMVIMVTETEMVTNGTGKFARKHEERLLHHVNVEAIQPLDTSELVRRLKKKN